MGGQTQGICEVPVGVVPQGKTKTSHDVALLLDIHPTTAELVVTAVAAIKVGLGQVGAGSHVTEADQPALFITLSLLKRKVKQPSELVEVNGPGIVVPQKAPGKPPGILFPLLPLDI